MNLHGVENESRCRVHLLVAHVALEVFCLLVLNENFVVFEVAFAVPVVSSASQGET